METYQAVMALAARALLSALMFYAALFNILNWSDQVAHMAEYQLPMPALVIFGATAVELALGLPLLLGFQTRWVAPLLAAYTLLCAVVLHAFWAAAPGDRANQELHFVETLGAVGGLLMLAAFGPGRLSIDARRSRGKVSV